MKQSFFHYSNKQLEHLVPRHGDRRHDGEASNAVREEVVYLHDRKKVPCDKGEPLRYQHEVQIDEADPLLEEEDPEWAPNVWIYKGTLAVVGVSIWNDATHAYEMAD